MTNLSNISANLDTAPLDRCQMCLGAKGGVPGYESIVLGVRMCDHCSGILRTADEATEMLDEYDAVLRSLAFYLSAGGYNSEGLIDPRIALDKIKWGIDYMVTTESTRTRSWFEPNARDREKFEYWAVNSGYPIARHSDTAEEYSDPRTNATWSLWCFLTCPAQRACDGNK
jgi:hypothetical protein